jgi:hypothetical protein
MQRLLLAAMHLERSLNNLRPTVRQLPRDAPLGGFDKINEVDHFRQVVNFRLRSFNSFIKGYPDAKENTIDFF